MRTEPEAFARAEASVGALRVDLIAGTGHGICAELLPEVIRLDDWGYPILDDAPVPPELLPLARRTLNACPALALRLELPPQRR